MLENFDSFLDVTSVVKICILYFSYICMNYGFNDILTSLQVVLKTDFLNICQYNIYEWTKKGQYRLKQHTTYMELVIKHKVCWNYETIYVSMLQWYNTISIGPTPEQERIQCCVNCTLTNTSDNWVYDGSIVHTFYLGATQGGFTLESKEDEMSCFYYNSFLIYHK